MRPRSLIIPILILIGVCLLGVVVYNLPPVNARLAWRVEALRAEIKYRLNPPEEAVFVPQQVVDATLPPTPAPSPTPLPPTPTSTDPAATPEPSLTPTPTATLLPDSVILEGVVYVDQHGRWNYCGPANLTMALKFWGWSGDRDDVAAVVKPGINDPNLDFIQRGKLDKNVMPYELANFVTDYTDYHIVVRYGGDTDLVKRMIASGFPVLVEKGYYEADYTGKIGWMGHYLFTTGYDEAKGEFIVQDAYLKPGKDMRVDYQTYLDGWRGFDYLFMIIYPPERETEVFELLGPYADSQWANQRALQIAEEEIQTQSGIDEFFAWFNKGTSHVNLLQYDEAALAYDKAFSLYARLGGDDTQRPYRIMWYQTGPYWAYFYTGRYQDTINLANTTLYDTIAEPTLEESLYWRGQAYLALGQTADAIADFREAVRLNPNFAPGLNMLSQLGVNP